MGQLGLLKPLLVMKVSNLNKSRMLRISVCLSYQELVVTQKIVGQKETKGMSMQTVGKREEEKIPRERVTATSLLTQKRRD